MTDETPTEGDAEAVEDLEAPAESQGGVVGGADTCGEPSFQCYDGTCKATTAQCSQMSHNIVVREQ